VANGATDLPVSADLGRGFGDTPGVVAETIRFAAEVGLVGCTIEDATGTEDHPLYDFGLAVERIAAGAEAAHALQFSFILTAQAHNFAYATPSLDETISRFRPSKKREPMCFSLAPT
jgi:2-methylisocitrate lyase-like PEP mutase family enzyme